MLSGVSHDHCTCRKGIGLIFPNSASDIVVAVLKPLRTCGNASELGDADTCPGKSCLFFIRRRLPGIESLGDREMASVEHFGFGVSGAHVSVLENPRESVIFVPNRTHIRSRSPR